MKYRKRKNTKKCALIVLAVVLIAGGADLLWTFVLSPFDAQAQAGTVTSPGEIAARLQKEADDSTFRIKVNKEPEFEMKDAEGSLFLENPADSKYKMHATVIRNDTKEEVYESGILLPGGQELMVKLKKALAPGDYPATVNAEAIDMETGETVGSIQTEITLHIKG